MKPWIVRISMLLIMLLTACAPRIYGVPQERWETMSEQERIAAMEAYKARQEALRQQRAEQARLRAMEKEAQLAREAEEARQRQLQIDAIYRGEGMYGDMLRVTLEGGMLEIRGHHQPFHPVAFKIAASEVKDIEIVSKRGLRVRMTAQYDGSNLLLDETPRAHRSTALRLPYEDAWEDGATYADRSTRGPLELKGVDVTVQVVGKRPVDHRRRRHPSKVIVVQQPAEKPRHPEVIVIQQPVQEQRHPEVVVVQQPVKKPRHPEVVVVQQPVQEQRRPEVVVVQQPVKKPRRPESIVVEAPAQQQNHMMAAAPQTHNGETGKFIKGLKHPDRIKVVFRKGQLVLSRQRYPLAPQTVYLRDGQSRSITMRGAKRNLKIRVSYVGGELLIDDSAGKSRNGTRLGFAPGWKNGQAYAIKASSNRALEDLDVLVLSQ